MSLRKPNPSLLSLVLFLAFPMVAHAGERPEPKPAEMLTQMFDTMCPNLAAKLLSKPEIKSILIPGRDHVAELCTCANARFFEDKAFLAKFDQPLSEVQKLMNTEKFQAYFFGHTFRSVFSCTATEFELMLEQPGVLP